MSGPSPSGTAQVALNCDWSERRNSYNVKLSWRLEVGCSLFGRFFASAVGLEPSEKTTTKCTHPPFQSPANNETSKKSMGCTKGDKCAIKYGRNRISLRYLIWNINEHH